MKEVREETLKKAMECVCGERDMDYGRPENTFCAIADLWNVYLGDIGLGARDVAVMMILLKIARIEVGHAKSDSWVDIAGYAACGAEIDSYAD